MQWRGKLAPNGSVDTLQLHQDRIGSVVSGTRWNGTVNPLTLLQQLGNLVPRWSIEFVEAQGRGLGRPEPRSRK